MAILPGAFVLNVERQTTLQLKATFDYITTGYIDIALNYLDIAKTVVVSRVDVNSATAGTVMVGFSLRLPPGNYSWLATLNSPVANGLKKGKIVLEYLHNQGDDAVGLPYGTIYPFSNGGTNNPYFMFSGLGGNTVSIQARSTSLSPLSGILKLENLDDGSVLNSPVVFNNFNSGRAIWTEISFLVIKHLHRYKASFTVTSDNLNPMGTSIRLG
jgi:hypothetical protein